MTIFGYVFDPRHPTGEDLVWALLIAGVVGIILWIRSW